MTTLRDAVDSLMKPGIMKVIAADYKQWDAKYPKYFNLETSKKKAEDLLSMEGLEVAATKNEGASVTYDDITEGYKNTLTNLYLAIGTRVTEECWDDDQYAVFEKKAGKFLSRSMLQRKELLGANVLSNGFTAAYTGSGQTTTGDAKALFASNHPFKSGGTYSNLLTTAADLTPTSLEAMIVQLKTAKEANSSNIMLMPKLLIVASANIFNASTILESQRKSGTANNDKNVFLDLDLGFIEVPFLSDDDAWFVESDAHELIYLTRRKERLETDNDFDTGDAKLKLTARYSAGYGASLGIIGTPGA